QAARPTVTIDLGGSHPVGRAHASRWATLLLDRHAELAASRVAAALAALAVRFVVRLVDARARPTGADWSGSEQRQRRPGGRALPDLYGEARLAEDLGHRLGLFLGYRLGHGSRRPVQQRPGFVHRDLE